MEKLDLGKVREYGNLELLARQMVEGFITGLHKSPFHGFSVEFAEHRLYNSGESTKHIDWKVFGKTDRLFVKRYEEETNLRCHLLIDSSSSMYYPAKNNGKLTFSCLAAATLANLMKKQRDAVSLTAFSDKIEVQTAVKSTGGHIHQIYVELEKLMTQEQTNKTSAVADTLHLIADSIHKRSLVVIFSDMFEKMDDLTTIFSALQHLKHNKHEVLIFHVTEQSTERDFNFDERPYEFIDVETGEKVRAQPSQVKDQYKTAVQSFYKDLRLKCGQYKIDFVEADINQGFDQVMAAFLTRRAKMK
ncbi:DUF58 domain-containing protein [uncultured Arcticibacterium sp.]|uniref:DUF58 domain-containing protein n=1 Tax=uncultured Arcticibacterium sp. TaxID=2173042 RepID=UPI0030F97193